MPKGEYSSGKVLLLLFMFSSRPAFGGLSPDSKGSTGNRTDLLDTFTNLQSVSSVQLLRGLKENMSANF